MAMPNLEIIGIEPESDCGAINMIVRANIGGIETGDYSFGLTLAGLHTINWLSWSQSITLERNETATITILGPSEQLAQEHRSQIDDAIVILGREWNWKNYAYIENPSYDNSTAWLTEVAAQQIVDRWTLPSSTESQKILAKSKRGQIVWRTNENGFYVR